MIQRYFAAVIVLVASAIFIGTTFILTRETKIGIRLRLKNKQKTSEIKKQECQLNPNDLDVNIGINQERLKNRFYKLSYQPFQNNVLMKYGPETHQPRHCMPQETIAIIVPIRNRAEHLHILLGHLHLILQKQLLRYQIFVVTQTGNDTFNKGRLMNTGFLFASNVSDGWKNYHFSCYIFHDVDLLAESELNLYRCGKKSEDGKKNVYHMAHSIDKFDYRFCCGITVGGVIAFTKEQFFAVNGFSNQYWGWGGEDDDMWKRVSSKYQIERVFGTVTRFQMIQHGRDQLNPKNKNATNMLGTFTKLSMLNDGVSNVKTKILSVHYEPLFVNITVDVGTPS